MKSLRLFILFLIFCSSFVFAEKTKPLTLAESLKEAALNNPEMKAAFENWKATLEQISQTRALDDPKFTFSYFIQEVETRVGPMEDKFTLMQTFPWFGEIEAKTDAASAAAKAARAQYEAVKLKLFQQVKQAYFEYGYLETAIKIAEENLQLLTHFEEIVRAKYRTAATDHPDVIHTQIELAILDDILKSLQQLRSPTAAQLNTLLNRPVESDLPWPEDIPLTEITIDRGTIVKDLLKSNPELAAAKWQIQTARSRVDLARTRFYPNMGVGVDWTGIGSDIMIPMAIPVFGGMTIEILTMLVVPVLYCSLKEMKVAIKNKNSDS